MNFPDSEKYLLEQALILSQCSTYTVVRSTSQSYGDSKISVGGGTGGRVSEPKNPCSFVRSFLRGGVRPLAVFRYAFSLPPALRPMRPRLVAVSYTHLTLPTILRV